MQHFRGFQSLTATLAITLLLALGGCDKSTPEQAVRAQIAAMQSAIDLRDAGDVQALLADDFIGNHGMDRRGAKQLAAGVFLRHREVNARIGLIEVELRGQTDAIARFTVLVTGGDGGLLPKQGQAYRVETGWRLLDGEWKLRSAHWDAHL